MPITIVKVRETVKSLTISTKTLLGAIVTGTSVLQIQQVRDYAIKNAVAHPRISSCLMGVTGTLVVLHNPQVQKFLHIEQETNIAMADGGTANVKTDTTVSVPPTSTL